MRGPVPVVTRLSLALSLVACTGPGRDATPQRPPDAVLPASAPPRSPAAQPPAGAVEPDSPAGEPRVEERFPAPSDAAAREDVPPWARCRIGTTRFRSIALMVGVFFPEEGRVLVHTLGGSHSVDVASGRNGNDILWPNRPIGVSHAGTCLAFRSDTGEVEVHRHPPGAPVTRGQLRNDQAREIWLADSCAASAAPSPSQPTCVDLHGAAFADLKKVCIAEPIARAVFSADGERIALTGASDNPGAHRSIHVIDTANQKAIAKVEKLGASLSDPVLSGDGKKLAVADGGRVRVVDVDERRDITLYSHRARGALQPITFSPSGKRLAFRSVDAPHRVGVLDVASGRLLWSHRTTDAGAARFSPSGALFAYEIDHTVRIVDALTGEPRSGPATPFPLLNVRDVALSPDGERVITSSAGHLSVWKSADCSLSQSFPREDDLRALVVLPGGAAVVGASSGVLERVNLADGKRARLSIAKAASIDALAVSPDAKTAALGIKTEDDSTIWLAIVDLEQMAEARRVRVPNVEPISALLFSRDGKTLYAVTHKEFADEDHTDGDVWILEIATSGWGVRRKHVIPDSDAIVNAALLNNDKTLVTEWTAVDLRTGRRSEPPSLLIRASSDGSDVVWAAEDGHFVWPADKPVPSTPPHRFKFEPGHVAVARGQVVGCNNDSCLVAGR